MRIGIVGWGVEGQSAFRYFGPKHEYLITNEEPRDDFPPESERVKVQFVDVQRTPGLTGNVEDLSYLSGLEQYDKIIYTPPAAKNLEKVFGKEPAFWAKAKTAQHIFFETVKTGNVIGVTGTKGKGTTSTLIAKLLEAEGKKVYLGGNIGNSPLDFVSKVQPGDWVVLELSNFQLYNFPYSPHIAVCLMISSEHQDWHPDTADYLEAKANIFRHQAPEDVAVFFAKDENSKRLAHYSPGKKVPYFAKPGARVRSDGQIVIGDDDKAVTHKSKVRLIGEHNLQNVCAALTAAHEAAGVLSKAESVLSSFSGLEHRLEFVRELAGVKYYDDSFATTPDSTIVALQAFSEPKVVILGGSDKGLPFDALADAVAKTKVRHAIIIGDSAGEISRLLTERGFTDITLGLTKMNDVVAVARKLAQPGDVVLLSTACASFGLFKDYKDRGNQFKESVKRL